jgi:hypothetical protein
MLGHHSLMAFLATTDGERACRFSGETLALPIVHDDGSALARDANGTRLRVQKVESFRRQGFTVIGWEVADVEATVDGLVARDVQFERCGGMDQDNGGSGRRPAAPGSPGSRTRTANVLSVTQL